MSSDKLELSIDFNGILNSDVRAKLIIEAINYFLYNSQQMSSMFNDLALIIKKQHAENLKNNKKPNKKLKSQIEHCNSLSLLFSKIKAIFTTDSAMEVRRVCFLLGSSINTYQQVFILNFPTGFYDGEILSFDMCKRKLFRTLATSDILTSGKPLTLSKFHVLIETIKKPGDDFLDLALQPVVDFKLDNRRAHQSLVNLNCVDCTTNHNLSIASDNCFDISGIEPLTDGKDVLNCSESSTIDGEEKEEEEEDEDSNDEAFMWYKVPCKVRGCIV